MDVLDTSGTTPLADFILARGEGARQWLMSKQGFRILSEPHDITHVAVRGDVIVQRATDAICWLAAADLVEGDLGHGALMADAATPRQAGWCGRFAQLVWRNDIASLIAFTDHFASIPLYWLDSGGFFAVATDLRLLLDAPTCRRELDMEAVFHYLNFAAIPSPYTICSQIRSIDPGTRLCWRDGRVTCDRYHFPSYPADLRGSDAALSEQLRSRIVQDVRAYRPNDSRKWGCFLSGGTDSSSIVSILKQQYPEQDVEAYSIGFAEAGYDELAFARIAADACGANSHRDTVDRERALRLVETLLDAYPQPFANASAIPTIACAQLAARDGLSCLLAGDGGDEIFGGNERYAKDRIMAAFHLLPSPIRTLARWSTGHLAGGHIHALNRIHNFACRASLPNPDRFYSDDAFASECYGELLRPEVRQAVDRDASLQFMRARYAEGGDAGELHRIMRLDLAMAIARNDLVKVHGACKSQGITARFPYLDTNLLGFTGRLPMRYKVRGLKKRYLFKRAMQGILPEAILRKRKQGFGLPLSVWMREDVTLRDHVSDVLTDRCSRERGLIEPTFASSLIDRHRVGGWDHSAQIWRLYVLELWLRRYFDAR